MGMMAYRYLSENFAGSINKDERAAGDAGFDYALLSDADADGMGEKEKQDLVKVRGYFLLPSQLFENVEKNCVLPGSV